MGCLEINFWLGHCCTNVAGNVQVVVILYDFIHLNAASVSFNRFFGSLLVGINDLANVVFIELMLAFSFVEM